MKKPIIIFIIKVSAIYILLMIPWPGLTEGYTHLYRGVGNVIFHSLWNEGVVEFTEIPTDNLEDQDTMIILQKRAQPGDNRPRSRGKIFSSSRYNTYVPTILVIALILAAPLPLPRKMGALLIGIFAVNCFALFKLWVLIYDAFTPTEIDLIQISPLFKSILSGTLRILNYIETGFIIPIFIWLPIFFFALPQKDRGTWLGLIKKTFPVSTAQTNSDQK
ncbi:MAG: hypothetical protein B6244_04705 [Candidatus Cloacimonetes bacterium 4572_55]|nr:MAG: hypothetical protein B6244_04705 [Candidatus Cloacimonetes bacterium 4572_55]